MRVGHSNVRRLNGSSFTWDIFRGNKTLSVSLIVLTVLHLSITSIPGLRDAFGLVPTTLAQWSLIIPLAIGCFLAIEGCAAPYAPWKPASTLAPL